MMFYQPIHITVFSKQCKLILRNDLKKKKNFNFKCVVNKIKIMMLNIGIFYVECIPSRSLFCARGYFAWCN